MLQETITLIPAIAGLVAAAGGVWAACAAHRSAVTAQKAARHAEMVDRRGLLRDLSVTAHRVVAESLQKGFKALTKKFLGLSIPPSFIRSYTYKESEPPRY